MNGWWRQAACRGADRTVFFPENGDYSMALPVCAKCVVRVECLESTRHIDTDLFGMFGGKTPKERAEWRDRER